MWLTLEVIFKNRSWIAEWRIWKPTTAAGAFFPSLSTNIALLAVITVSCFIGISEPKTPKTNKITKEESTS